MGVSVLSDAAQLIAANISDTRAIEGFLRKLATEAAAKGSTPHSGACCLSLSIKPQMIEAAKLLKRIPDAGPFRCRCFRVLV